MQAFFFRATALIALFILVAGAALAQGKRVALVIGNAKYKYTPPLANPANDAADVAAELRKLGFHVIEKIDLDKAVMDRTIRNFAEALNGAKVGLFFYAGHGLQVGGQNYLVPIDAKLTTASAIDFEMIRLDLVHRTMEREVSTNILMMDACRDNPLARNLARALGTRSAQVGRGLAVVESGEGTLISFSTQPGNVALDGAGRNSPYAGALVRHLATPGDDLPTILINVRNEVMKETGRRQVPWEHSAMTARFYFTPPKAGPPPVELEFWASVKDSTNPDVLRTYIERFPDGEFVTVAQALIEHYKQKLRAEAAAREEARRREEEVRKAAELRRLEEERRRRDEAEARRAAELKKQEEERQRLEQARAEERRRQTEDAQLKEKRLAEERRRQQEEAKLKEQRLAEERARNEELRKALEEVRHAREAAARAEQERLAALKAAEEASKAAETALAAQREAEANKGLARLAALPKLDTTQPSSLSRFDGTWRLEFTWNKYCTRKSGASPEWTIKDGIVQGKPGRLTGSVSADGELNIEWSPPFAPRSKNRLKAQLQDKQGEGRWHGVGRPCGGTVKLTLM